MDVKNHRIELVSILDIEVRSHFLRIKASVHPPLCSHVILLLGLVLRLSSVVNIASYPAHFLLLVCEKEPGYEAGIDVYVYPVLINKPTIIAFQLNAKLLLKPLSVRSNTWTCQGIVCQVWANNSRHTFHRLSGCAWTPNIHKEHRMVAQKQ